MICFLKFRDDGVKLIEVEWCFVLTSCIFLGVDVSSMFFSILNGLWTQGTSQPPCFLKSYAMTQWRKTTELRDGIPVSKDMHHFVRHQTICPVLMALLLNVWFLAWQGASLILVSDQASSMRMLNFLQEVYCLLYCIDNPVFQLSLIANRLFPVCVAIQTDMDRGLTCRLLQGKCKRLWAKTVFFKLATCGTWSPPNPRLFCKSHPCCCAKAVLRGIT